MAVEYDVVVIGGSSAGVCAAVAAAHLKARVALVENTPHETSWLRVGSVYSRAITHIGKVSQQMRDAHQFGIHWETNVTEDKQQILNPDSGLQTPDTRLLKVPSVRFVEAVQYARGVAGIQSEKHSPAILASLGIDVINGAGEFCRKPYLAFVVNGRYLRSRAYLIATGSRPAIPEIDGIKASGYFTPADIWQQDITKLPSNWVVIGGNLAAIELAQTLARLGASVTLAVSNSRILVEEDLEAAALIQAQLEAEGVRVLTESPVTQVKQILDKKWVQAGNKAIEADEILLADGYLPNVESLNLEGVGVKFDRCGIEVNKKLQTTNPRIYACGDVAGGSQLAHISDREARIALKNALFLPVFKVDYNTIPTAVFSDPMLARVGITEAEAKHRYGKNILVLRQYYKTAAKALLMGEITGFCKIVVRLNGEILGATFVGAEAEELIYAIAFAMQQKIKVGAIADLPAISSSFSEITQQAASQWHQQRLNRNTKLQDFLEGLFNWLRSRSK